MASFCLGKLKEGKLDSNKVATLLGGNESVF